MSIQAVGWALEQEIPALGPKLILVVLANHADHSSGLCWPSVKLIAHEASCSPRAVYRYIADLTRNGYVAVEKKRGKDGKQRSNNYWLLFDRADAKWSAVPASHAQDAEENADEERDIEDETSLADEPGDCQSPGENDPVEPLENAMTPGVNDKPGDVESPGPSATAGTRQESSLEPSELEPSRRAPLRAGAVPHGYDARARPTATASAAAEEARRRAKPVFVIEGTRAWDAWTAERQQRTGMRSSYPVTTAVIDGKARRGWWFPTLFPPSPTRLTDADARELAKL